MKRVIHLYREAQLSPTAFYHCISFSPFMCGRSREFREVRERVKKKKEYLNKRKDDYVHRCHMEKKKKETEVKEMKFQVRAT